MIDIAKALVRHVTERQWERAAELLVEGAVVELAWLRSAAGMRMDSARELMDVLQQSGACPKRTLLVFHDCAEHPVAEISAKTNCFPWRCPECEDLVRSNDELRYEVRLRLTQSVRFV